MRQDLTLLITSLVSIVLALIHLAEDIVRGFEPGRTETFNGVLIGAVWLYAVLGVPDGRVRYVLIMLLSIGGAGVSYIHMRGAGLAGGRIAGSDGVFLWVFTLLALGVASSLAAMLSLTGLWRLRRAK